MSELELTEKIDRAVDAIIRGERLDVAGSVAEFAAIARDLRHLPREAFRLSLKEQLERDAMNTATRTSRSQGKGPPKKQSTAAVRKGFRTVTPYLVVANVHEEIDFIRKVFDARGKLYGGLGSKGGFHSEYRIGDSMLMIGGGGKGAKWQGPPVPGALHAYVPDIDGVYEHAIEAGAKSLMPPTDMSYGERGAAIEDPGGNHWYIATAFGPKHVPEGLPSVMPYFNPVGAPRMLEFLKDALNAEEIAVYRSGQGRIEHAKLRIADSVIEMGEAHGQWQSRPMQFMVYVEDSDTAYARAMNAEGAISISAPANAPYGGRTGVIQDPWGNTWYLSSPTQKRK
jgi:PhnB protein